MKIEVVKGSVIYKGSEYKCGSTFNCEKGIAESLIKGNVARKIDEPADKPEESSQKETDKPEESSQKETDKPEESSQKETDK